MLEEAGRPAGGRPGRCAIHPGATAAGVCSSCGRPLCLGCAVPVRGELLGPECLPSVLGDAPPPPSVPLARSRRGDRLAIGGFGLVLLLSVLPWSRYGDSGGILGAWRPQWSLLAVLSAAAGLALAGGKWRSASATLVDSLLIGALALFTVATSILHYYRPPPLSAPSVVPLLASLAAGVAVLGAALAIGEVLRMRRALP